MRYITIFTVGVMLGATVSFAEMKVQDQPITRSNVFEEKCKLCHDLSRPLGKNLTRAEWEKVIKKMQAKAPDKIFPEDVEKILDFLATERPAK